MTNIIIITGGTGGHITPAISMAEELIRRNYNPIFITDKRFHEFNFKLPSNLVVHTIDSISPFAKGIKKKILFPFKTIIGIFKAVKLIRSYNPKLLISFGGYMSLPGLIAAIILNKKYMIHEQNSILGKANKFFAKKAYIIATSFKKIYNLEDLYKDKIIYTGNPIRSEVLNLREIGDISNLESEELNILIIGGSQGAQVFTEILPKAFSFVDRDFRKKISITQQCREEDIIGLRTKYHDLGINKVELKKFFPNICDYYKNSNLIIARSGASTVAEISGIGKASILVPFPYAAENHQFLNARSLVYEGAAWCIEENRETVIKIAEILNKIFDDFNILRLKTESAGKNFINAQIKLAEIIESI